MRPFRVPTRLILTLFLLNSLVVLPTLAAAQDDEMDTPTEATPVHPEKILVTDAVPLLLPAFHDDELAGV